MRVLRVLGKRIVLLIPVSLKTGVKGLLPAQSVAVIQRAFANSRTRPAPKRVDVPKPRKPIGRWVLTLEDRLWGGYAGYAVADLEAVMVSPRTALPDRVHAALVLGRFHAAKGNHDRALEKLAFARSVAPWRAAEKRVRSVEVYCLLAAGRFDDARHLAQLSLNHGSPLDGDNCAVMAAVERVAGISIGVSDGDRFRAADESLRWLSRPLESVGFVGISRKDSARDLALDNLGPAGNLQMVPEGPQVSVLMAAFNAQDNIETAIRSILQQTWRNLELVIVDDASKDNTWNVIDSLAREDSRITALRLTENVGAYAARNGALSAASGDYVVVNDSDDWAHPQKIEAQVRDLEAHEGHGANMTFRLRVDSRIVPEPRLDSPSVPLIHNDFSALMLPRERIIALGGWDPVRFSADAEFVERVKASEEVFELRKIYPNAPLSISLFDGGNLTAASATSIWTNRFGARQEYERGFRAWHGGPSLQMKRRSQIDPFPVPGVSYNPPGTRQTFDIVLVSDFRLPGGTTHCNLQYLRAFRQLQLRVAIVHWPRYDIEPKPSALLDVIRICRELGVVPLTHGEAADCDLLLIHHPPIMMWQPDAIPDVNASRVALLANQAAKRVLDGPNEMYEPNAVQERVKDNFGKTGEWIPISPLVRRMMETSGDFAPLSEEDWLPVLNLEHWKRDPVWRRTQRSRPIIGRHGRDQWIKWPADAAKVAAAYQAGQAVDVRLLGGANEAIKLLGDVPENWQVLPFGAEDVQTFLGSLDVFVNFIHDESIEAFGRNIMEAMAMGLPVVCSKSFQETFGEAAVYCEPEDVGAVLNLLWEDEAEYMRVAQRGQEFVARNCDLSRVSDRLNSLGIRSKSSNRAPGNTGEGTIAAGADL